LPEKPPVYGIEHIPNTKFLFYFTFKRIIEIQRVDTEDLLNELKNL